MSTLTALALRRPWATLSVWGLVIAVLAVLGLGVQQRLGETSIALRGTESDHATAIDRAGFGPNEAVPVVLHGPRAALDRQGPSLVRALRQHWSALSPWDSDAESSHLRPSPQDAVVLADIRFRAGAKPDARLHQLRSILRTHIESPVRARVNGVTVVSEALTIETLDSATKAQFIAIPVLLIVLLLVFRAPLAAAVPAIVGFATVMASAAIIALLAHVMEITALAVSMAAMMGLALGVDYSLLIVSRFREELASQHPEVRSPGIAAATAATTAGRTVIYAGAALLIAMLVAVLLSPGNVLVSLTTGVVVAVLLSVISGAAIVPALLMVLGTRINRWRLGAADPESIVLPGLARLATSNAVPVLLGPLCILLFLAAPALGLHTAAPNPRVLPKSNPVRQDYERLVDLVGYGYVTPFEIALRSRRGVITEPHTLQALQRFQRSLAIQPDVAGVIGPGPLADRARPVLTLPRRIGTLEARASRAAAGVARLRQGLEAASTGAGRLRDGAAAAANGVAQLQGGSDRLASGAGALSGGVNTAASGIGALAQQAASAAAGAGRLRDGTNATSRGAQAILAGLKQLASGVGRLETADRQLADGLRFGISEAPSLVTAATTADQQLAAAYKALQDMTVGRGDPQYAVVVAAVANAKAATGGTNPATGEPYDGEALAALQQRVALLTQAADAASKLSRGASRLRAGAEQLRQGMTKLVAGLQRVGAGQAALSSGLDRATTVIGGARTRFDRLARGAVQLAGGTNQLSAGLDRLGGVRELAGGNATLARRLGRGYWESKPLEEGLATSARTIRGFPSVRGQAAQGHLVLAGADSATPSERSQAAFVLDTSGAGQTARIFVFPRTLPIDAAGGDLRDHLSREAAQFGRVNRMEAAVGGMGSLLNDFKREVSAFVPLLILCLSLLTYVFLVVVLRALILPAVAILLNLLIVAATFGVMTVLFQGRHPVLGGPGFVDVVTVAGVFTVLFALSIDYQVFLLTRMREGYDRMGDADQAVIYGIRHTARVVTGAAFIMAAVFLSFGSSEFIIPRQFGVGLSIAVLLDAIVLRLFMLPAVMHLLGERGWWMPSGLKRRLPVLRTD